ncbi:MAG: S1 RNA-binding domain-containing protein [Treponema sp.]|nr:S1 RNA-binding domain-containing protein [Treponema sp.]
MLGFPPEWVPIPLLPLVQAGQSVPASKIDEIAAKYNLGVTTVRDIVDELQKPNRDPRDGYPAPIMQKGVLQFEDLKEGMKVTGKIKNVVDFGAFVDIGLHETGLVHLSELSDNFVNDPMEVVKVGDVFEFTIINLDKDRRRIGLSLKSDAMSRIGQSNEGSSKGPNKRVVVVKKGANNEKSPKNTDFNKNSSKFDKNDDGMSYNPFAAFFNK